MRMSSRNGLQKSLRYAWSTLFINAWKSDGAFVNTNGITQDSNNP